MIERNKSRQELDKLLVLTTNHVLQNKQKCCVLHSLILAYIRIFRSVFTAFGDEVLFCTRQFSSKSRVNCVKISCSTIHLLARALLVISGCGVQSLKTIHRDSVKMGQTKCAILIYVLSLKTNFISVFFLLICLPLLFILREPTLIVANCLGQFFLLKFHNLEKTFMKSQNYQLV